MDQFTNGQFANNPTDQPEFPSYPPQTNSTQTTPANTPIPTPKTSGKPKILKTALFGLFIVIAALLIEGINFYVNIYTPGKKASLYVTKVLPAVEDISTQITKVNDNLVEISDYIKQPTQPKEPGKSAVIKTDDIRLGIRSVFPSPQTGRVAGVKENILDNLLAFSRPVRDLKERLSNLFAGIKSRTFGASGKPKVAGETTLEDDLTTRVRQLKEIAIKGEDLTKEGIKRKDNLKTLIANDEPPATVKNVHQSIKNTLSQTETYLSEAEKITKYYNFVSGVNIDLVPAMKSMFALIVDLVYSKQPGVYLGKISELDETLKKMQKSLRSYPANNIPEGLSRIHEDNIKMLDAMVDFVDGVRSAVTKLDFPTLVQSATKFQSDVEILSTRALTEELSFWQDNKIVRGYTDLSGSYSTIKKDLLELKKNSQVSLF